MGTSGQRHHGFSALAGREINRVTKLWSQTIAAPVVSSALFIVVFGLSIGGRIDQVEGIDYKQFIVPGLITMGMAQAAYSNNSSTVFQARFDRYINDVLSAPMAPWEVNLGLNIGGAVRALAIGILLFAIAAPLTGVGIAHPLVLLVSTVLLLIIFCTAGIISGVYAQSFDFLSFVTNIVLLPLTFLGGVFYAIDTLPSPWEEVSHVNPVFYLVNAMRYGFIGVSDVSVWLALGVTALFAIGFSAWSAWLFRTGHKLKP